MFCSKCGTQQDDSAKACSNCNAALNQTIEASSQPVTLTNDDLFSAFIGEGKNKAYYLNHFNRFDADGKTSATWHWPAFFVTFFWFLYRKMWLHAVLYFMVPGIAMSIIVLIVGVIASAAGVENNTLSLIVIVLYIAYVLALFILPAMYANALYYKAFKSASSATTARRLTGENAVADIARNGGTSIAGIIAPFALLIPITGILAAIAIPAYQDYTIKARLAQTYTIEQEVALAVDAYYNQHQKLPTNLAEAGYTTPLPVHIKSLTINPENGTLVATLAGAQIEGKVLLLTPSKDENNSITWACQDGTNDSNTIGNKYLPSACKQQ